jgi:ABC-type bacteriocin/lantibiotic exporter with double-glycine peptidase domain
MMTRFASGKLAIAFLTAIAAAGSIAAMSSASAAADGMQDMKLEPHISECGVASVYRFLAEVGIEVSPDDIGERFRQLHPGCDLASLSMKQLVDVLHSYGMVASAVRYRPARIDDLPVPAILFVKPQPRARVLGTGHFAVLTSVGREYATVIDLTQVNKGRDGGVVHVDKRRVRTIWNGEAILVSPPNRWSAWLFSDRSLGYSAATLLATAIVAATSTWRKMKHPRVDDQAV